MKKIFYILASAIVALGAVACENEGLENVNPANGEGLTIAANITKVAWEGVQPTWESGDAFDIEGYTFTTTDGVNFVCKTEGVHGLVGKTNVEVTFGEFDSANGLAGTVFTTTIDEIKLEGTEATFAPQNAVLMFTAAEGTKITFASENLFSAAEVTVTATGAEQYVAVKAGVEGTFSYSIYGIKCNEKKGFTATTAKFYNIGALNAPEALENWGIVGAHQSWATATPDALYKIHGSNTYARMNVSLSEFKFYGETTKNITTEHPAVTTGEEGYLYLQPNSNWKVDNARFAAYFFGNGEEWKSMKDENGDGIYVVEEPSKTYPNVIFCRMNPSAPANNWNNKWNQTGDLTIPSNGNNLFTVPSGAWDGSTTSWSKHTPEVKDAWTEETVEITSYWVGKNSSTDISKWVSAYSNNLSEVDDNIKLTNTSTKYDVYFHLGEEQDWGFVINYCVVEHGTAVELK